MTVGAARDASRTIQGRQLVLRWDRDRDPLELRRREWLITNGLGGYASGTIAGIPTRKYHGLFVPNLARAEGPAHHDLALRRMRGHTDGASCTSAAPNSRTSASSASRTVTCKEFRLDHRIAVWTFELDDVVLEKSIVMPHNQNTVCVQYRLLRGERLDLQVRPFVAFPAARRNAGEHAGRCVHRRSPARPPRDPSREQSAGAARRAATRARPRS